jgi:riboflavin synthase
MFTGLIEEVGIVGEVARGAGPRICVRASRVIEDLKPGDSIAVSGPCLTVEEVSADRFWAALLPETAERTTLGGLRRGARVNLERPPRVGDRIGGHLVAGHVDGQATVTSATERNETRLVRFESPAGLERYLVDRGSVALDGVSLTVVEPRGRQFAVALVGATLAATTLGDLRPGDRVNIEADLLAKHIERFMETRERDSDSQGLVSWLAESEP